MKMTFTLVALALGLASNPALASASPAPTVHPAVTGPVVTVDERGNPQIVSATSGPVTTLEQTRWRVTRLNGHKVPRRGNYHVDFDSGRILAKFGCSTVSSTYNLVGTTLNAGALVTSRMACNKTTLEIEGSAILGGPMAIRVTGRNALTLSGSSGSIDLVRR